MTSVLTRPAPPTPRASLRTLAGVESRRYARHPLFLIGLVLLTCYTYVISRDAQTSEHLGAAIGDATFPPAFLLGLLGVFVGHQLTRSMDRAADAVEAAPLDGVRRTAALCVACAVPGVVAVVWVAWMHVVLAVWPVPESAAISDVERSSMLVAAIAYSVGGPLFGVLVARWTSFRGAGLVAALTLVVWYLIGSFALVLPASRLGTLLHLSAPWTVWTSSDGQGEPTWVAGGSPQWYLVYLCLLCALAVTAALYRTALQAHRPRFLRSGLTLAVLAVCSLGLAAAPDPTRLPL